MTRPQRSSGDIYAWSNSLCSLEIMMRSPMHKEEFTTYALWWHSIEAVVLISNADMQYDGVFYSLALKALAKAINRYNRFRSDTIKMVGAGEGADRIAHFNRVIGDMYKLSNELQSLS